MKPRRFTIVAAASLLLFMAGRTIVWRLESSHVTATLGPGLNSWHWDGPPVYVGVSGDQYYVPDHWRIAERWGEDSSVLLWRVTDGSRVGWYLIVRNELLPAPFAVLPLLWVCGKCWRVLRHRDGHCEQCDYDLRATPGRCPECGTVVEGR